MKHTDHQEATSPTKRRLLSVLGTGGGVLGISALVPATWVKPVVNAVMLPAHAVHSPGHEARGAPVINGVGISTNSITNANELFVSWGPPADSAAAANVDSYAVRYRKDAEGEDFSAPVTVQPDTALTNGNFERTFPLTDAMPEESYVVEVRAVYDVTEDEEPASTEDDATTIATDMVTLPEARSAPVITSFAFSNNSLGAMNTDGVTVAWTAPTDAAAAANVDQYIVRYRRSSPDPETEFRPLENFDSNLFAPDAPSLRKRFVLGSNSPDLTSEGVVITGRSFFVQVEAVYNDADGNPEEAGMYIATDTVGPYDPDA